MRRIHYILVLFVLQLVAPSALAGDKVIMMPLAPALATQHAHRELRSGVAFHFGTEPGLSIAQKLGSIAVNRRSILNPQDPAVCDRVLIAALVNLAKDAEKAGANAVVNIVSGDGTDHVTSSQTEYACHKGAAVTRVMLHGDLVRLSAP